MSKIEEMIKRLCPKGVERVSLQDCCDAIFSGGTPLTSHKEYYDGNIPWIRSGEIDFNRIYEADRNITIEGLGNSSAKMIRPKSVVMAMTGATVAKVATIEVEVSANQSVCALEPKDCLNYRYLFFYLVDNYHQLKSSAQGALTSLNLQRIKKIEIPIPDLSIQREIVSVLDSFTTLIDKMKQEVVLRKKQMENYRGMVFAKYKGEVQKMENFVLLKAGKTISSSELSEIPNSEHRFKCYGGNGIRGYASNFIYEGNYAIIGRQGALCGSVNWVNEKFYATEHAVICFPKPNVESRFLYWLFVNSNLNQYKSQGAQPGLAVSRLNELCFPIPSISTQRSIVSTLDAFEQYISKLERLITLREKQYAYYREKLLTFE